MRAIDLFEDESAALAFILTLLPQADVNIGRGGGTTSVHYPLGLALEKRFFNVAMAILNTRKVNFTAVKYLADAVKLDAPLPIIRKLTAVYVALHDQHELFAAYPIM